MDLLWNMTYKSSQDDATVKCWGWNANGDLGYGDTSNRGDGNNGGCPARPTRGCARRKEGWSWWLTGCSDAEMGANLPAIDLGPGRTAVSVSSGHAKTCAVLVRSGWEDSGAGAWLV